MLYNQFSSKFSRLEKTLLGILRGEYNSFEKINFEANLFDIASKNEVASIVTHQVVTSAAADSISIDSSWRLIHDKENDRIQSYLDELDRVAAKLAEHDIPLVALKNSGIARGIYPHPGAVPMGDIDVLVEKRHFRRAHELLLGMGYTFEFRSDLEEEDLEEAEAGGGAEYWKMLPNGEKLWFELQWRPVAGRWIRPDQEPSAAELMARSIPIDGSEVRLLSPEDNLLQVALHTAKHSYVRAPGFRLHLDVERIVRYQTIDWELFVKRVKQLKVKTAVYFSLLIPAELFETPIPPQVLIDLRPGRIQEKFLIYMLNRAGLLYPHQKKFNRVEYICFNALLYDSLSGLWRGIFPDPNWMQERYQFQNRWLLPYYHLVRLSSLLFRRLAT
ncbi:MAG: nucleotidyltransferase family protein [Ardenticatenaceae bacterium]|nr:nucleotidyltransferase family protein [Ardenticatenaceae bacterium]